MKSPTVRIARPSDDPDALIGFYCNGLGLEVLGRFEDHDGFDGIMIGCPGGPYHFEFTRKQGHYSGRAPTKDHLAVFYLPDFEVWAAAVQRMNLAGFAAVPPFNPYWERRGVTFEDPDGYRVVLENAAWA